MGTGANSLCFRNRCLRIEPKLLGGKFIDRKRLIEYSEWFCSMNTLISIQPDVLLFVENTYHTSASQC